jgi:hypothetical protein
MIIFSVAVSMYITTDDFRFLFIKRFIIVVFRTACCSLHADNTGVLESLEL